MTRCWDPDPTNRPTANELCNQILYWNGNQEIKNKFSKELESTISRTGYKSTSPEKSQNLLTSKRLNYSKILSQLLKTKNTDMKTNDDGMLFFI